MVVDRKLSEAELFQVVGAGWKQQESEKRKKTFQEKLKGKPVFSAFLLFLIVLGCVFANVVANHDPSGFYLQNLNTPPGKEFIFGTDSLGRDILPAEAHLPLQFRLRSAAALYALCKKVFPDFDSH